MQNIDKAMEIASKLQSDIEIWYLEQEKNIRDLKIALDQWAISMDTDVPLEEINRRKYSDSFISEKEQSVN